MWRADSSEKTWCWERLKTGIERDDRGCNGWMASPTWWTWVQARSGRWWKTGKPGMLLFMGLQRVWHNWVTQQQTTTIHRRLSTTMLISFIYSIYWATGKQQQLGERNFFFQEGEAGCRMPGAAEGSVPSHGICLGPSCSVWGGLETGGPTEVIFAKVLWVQVSPTSC